MLSSTKSGAKLTRNPTLTMMLAKLGSYFFYLLFVFFFISLLSCFAQISPLLFTVRLRKINELLSVLHLQRYCHFACASFWGCRLKQLDVLFF